MANHFMFRLGGERHGRARIEHLRMVTEKTRIVAA
jgi:hypothetical protein